MSEESGKITVFYDGACPRCAQDRRQYEKLAGKRGEEVCWFDIQGREEQLQEMGIDPEKALTELHIRLENREIRSELDAYILLMRRVPLLKPLAWLIGLPWLKPWLGRLYRESVLRRLRREGRL
jgi:predicted DCC family thiol-disulfide oxidoreductase YuxK